MIGPFGNSVKALLKNPFVLLPAVAAMAIAITVSDMAVLPLLEALIDFSLLQGGMELGLFEAVSIFSKQYSGLVLLVLASFFFSTVLSAMLALFYSGYASRLGKKNAFSESLKSMFASLPGAFGIVLSGMVFALLASAAFFIAFIALPPHMISGLLLGIAIFAFAFFFIKLFLFAVPAMAFDGLNARNSLAASWRLTSRKFFESLLALLVAIMAGSAIANMGLLLLLYLGENILSLAVSIVFEALVFAFAALFFAFYYQDNRKETEPKEAKRRESWKKRAKK